MVRIARRGVTPVVGVVLLVAITVGIGATVGVALQSGVDATAPPQARFDLAVAGGGRITLTHVGGDPVDADRLRIRVTVEGEPLAHQPPVPFFAAEGFESGPTGPFNLASDPHWTAGERGGVRVASTNHPRIDPGDRVRVRVAVGEYTVWDGTAIARDRTTRNAGR